MTSSTSSFGSGDSSKSCPNVKLGSRSNAGLVMLKLIGAFLAKSVSNRFSSTEGMENDMGEFSAKFVGARSSEG